MKTACSACGKPIAFEDSRFGDRTSVKVRCPSCQAVLTLNRPQPVELTPVAPPPASPAQAMAAPAAPQKPAASSPPPAQAAGEVPMKGSPTLKVKREAVLLDEQIVEEIPPLPKDRRVSLAILTGNGAGKVLPCARSRVVLGREGSDIPVDDDEVSRRHALLEIHDDRYILKDLGSTNGTFVDERRITEMEIADRGEFRVGSTQFMLIVTPVEDL